MPELSVNKYDQISINLAKINALLASITGEGFQTFECLNDDLQHTFLMTISDLVIETRDVLKHSV